MFSRRFVLLAGVLVSLNVALWFAASGLALRNAVVQQVFGPKLVRLEVIEKGGADWRIDCGVITSVNSRQITLREADGRIQAIPLSTSTIAIRLGRRISLDQLTRHWDVLVRWRANGTPLLLAYAAQETGGPRVIVENEDWLAVVPFWAAWPFEALVVPKRAAERLPDLADAQRNSLATILIDLLGRYDNLFNLPFPYSMGWHQAPFREDSAKHWQVHAHFYPPLLRSASVRKFMVGYELLAETQRDLSAEEAAERLRASSPVHYRLSRTGG